jgi:TonB-dependent starch-binding outer membrane protein SusC
MKLTTFLLTLGLMSVYATGVSQQVTYSGEKVKLTDVFKAIKKQTGFFVISEKTLLNNASPVTVSAVKQPLEAFLQNVLKGQHLGFTIEKNTIVISAEGSRGDSIWMPAPIVQAAAPVTGTIYGPDAKPLQV